MSKFKTVKDAEKITKEWFPVAEASHKRKEIANVIEQLSKPNLKSQCLPSLKL